MNINDEADEIVRRLQGVYLDNTLWIDIKIQLVKPVDFIYIDYIDLLIDTNITKDQK